VDKYAKLNIDRVYFRCPKIVIQVLTFLIETNTDRVI